MAERAALQTAFKRSWRRRPPFAPRRSGEEGSNERIQVMVQDREVVRRHAHVPETGCIHLRWIPRGPIARGASPVEPATGTHLETRPLGSFGRSEQSDR